MTKPVKPTKQERCAICNCKLNRSGKYGLANTESRAHASKHHYVAERFFGRSANRRGTLRDAVFGEDDWKLAKKTTIYCYECHELLLHNPVLLDQDVENFAQLVKERHLHEDDKPENRTLLASRIKLLNEVIRAGLTELKQRES